MKEPLVINIVGRISHFFLMNRSLSILFLVAVMLLGSFSFWLTPKQYNPEIIRPAFLISLEYAGASVDEAREKLVYELVEKVRTVPGVDDIFTEIHDGASVNTTVIFAVGYDATKAKLDLLSQLQQHTYLKTGRINSPAVMEINPETIPVLQLVFGSDDMSLAELRDSVVGLSHSVGNVKGVSEVTVHGGYTESLVVEVDPYKLTQAGVSLYEVMDILQSSQTRVFYGGINSGVHRIDVWLDGQLELPSEVGSLLLKNDIKIRDVANVYLGTAGSRAYVFNKENDALGEVVILAVSKREGSSAPVVTNSVISQLDKILSDKKYQSLEYKKVGDDGETASSEINGLTKNLLTSIGIVAIVLVLFLSTRAALVVLVSIPVTLLIVFALGLLFDQTINRITLFALILSLGLLVDSAIVVVENIHSHIKEWRLSLDARSREHVVSGAVHEIGIGLLLSTVTSVIVFLPLAFITGMMGPYMGPIAFFVPAALLVSLLVAIVVTPFVAARLIGGEEKTNSINQWFAKAMLRITQVYTNFLRKIMSSRTLQRRLLSAALSLFILSLLLPMLALVHFQMLPKADRDQFYLYVDLPVDINVEANREFSEKVVGLLLEDDDVLDAQMYVGQAPVLDFNGMFKGAQNRNQSYQTTVRINLVPASDRPRSSTEIVNALRTDIVNNFGSEGQYVRFIEEPPGPPVRATFEAKIITANETALKNIENNLIQILGKVNGVVDINSSLDEEVSRVVYQFDHQAAESLGVSIDSVDAVLRLLDGDLAATEFLSSDNKEFTSVIVTLATKQANVPASIQGFSVKNQAGQMISLDKVLKVDTQMRPSSSYLEGSASTAYVTAEIADRSIVYVMIDLIKTFVSGGVEGVDVAGWGLFGLDLTELESGAQVHIGWGGEWEMTLENFRDLGVAMGVALLLVYTVLVAQYKKFSTPAYILVTVPLGLVGILFGFFVLDTTLNIYLTATALIGFISLIGIVVNNAIIYLEYVEQMIQKGHVYTEALVEAGAARLRPIVLTSLTTILGSLTIVSDPVWSGLAWAIVFGLSLSTVLTLVIYPTLLVFFTSKEMN